MTGGEEEPKKDDRIGFAGMSSLVSDLGADISPPVPRKEPTAEALRSSSPPSPWPWSWLSELESSAQHSDSPLPHPPSDWSSMKWLTGVVLVIALLLLTFHLNKSAVETDQSNSQRTSQATNNSAQGYSTARSSAAPPQSSAHASSAQNATPATPGSPEASPIVKQQTSAVSPTAQNLKEIQRILTDLGYNLGPSDGIIGNRTRSAISAFQRSAGIPADGNPSIALLEHLRVYDLAIHDYPLSPNAKVKTETPSPDFSRAPNGHPWPARAGYVQGYRRLRDAGLSWVTIDNTKSSDAVFLKLYVLDATKPYPARQFYIPAHGKFTLTKLSPGSYEMRYRDLQSGRLYRSQTFQLKNVEMDDGIRYTTLTMTLYKVSDGNAQVFDLDERDF